MTMERGGLVRVFSPDTDAELAAIIDMLEAHEVACFAFDARLRRASSGVQRRCAREPRAILVPWTQVAQAVELIRGLRASRATHFNLAWIHSSVQIGPLVRLMWLEWIAPALRRFNVMRGT